MVDRGRVMSAVPALVIVPPEHAATAHWNRTAARDAHIAVEQDDRRPLKDVRLREDGMLGVVREHGRLLVDDEHDRPLEADDGEGFISGVQYERAHATSFAIAPCTACRDLTVRLRHLGTERSC